MNLVHVHRKRYTENEYSNSYLFSREREHERAALVKRGFAGVTTANHILNFLFVKTLHHEQ